MLVARNLIEFGTTYLHYTLKQVAYKRAVLNAIDYLSKFGYTKEQVRGNVHACTNTHACMHAWMDTHACMDTLGGAPFTLYWH